MSLDKILAKRIEKNGPISIEEYMGEALSNSEYGYYMHNDPVGAKGDFITAPEITQIFGELIGAWCADSWRRMGFPTDCILVELGPGRGTMMKDILRATKAVDGFHDAISVCMMETSPTMRGIQRKTLKNEKADIKWYNDIAKLPEKPIIFVANEFFDALPVKQYVMRKGGFREQLVGVSENGEFKFVVDSNLSTEMPKKRIGTVMEICPTAQDIMSEITAKIGKNGGAGIIIDYGYKTTVSGDTLQAMKKHSFYDMLKTPGEADITAHVDFKALKNTALKNENITAFPVISQQKFLINLCIKTRLKQLMESAKSESQANELKSAVERLISPDKMGKLFKVMAISHNSIKNLAGF